MKTFRYINNSIWSLIIICGILIAGCSGDDDEQGPAPTAAFEIGENSTLVQGETVFFNSTSTNAFSYKWAFGDGNASEGKNVTHVYELPGTYTVTLEASGSGQRDVTSQEIIIAGLIPQTSFSVVNDSDLRVATAVQFVNETVNGLSYVWEFGDADNSTSTDENPTFTYTQAGDYDVTLTSTGTGGESSVTMTITVNPNNFELYFIDNTNGKIRKIDLNDPTTIIDVFNLSGYSFGLTYDPDFDELYYSDDDVYAIYRNSIDGSNEVEIASGLGSPRDIALDLNNDRLFFSDRFTDEIVEVNVNDGTFSALYSTADDATFQLPVGLDLHNGVLYGTAVEIDAEAVWTGSVDGGNLTRIIDYTDGGYGYGLEVDKINDKIYFDDTEGNRILRADLDGTNIEQVGTTSDRVYGIAINNETGKYYFASRDGVIKEANLDGTEEVVLIDTTVDIRGLIIRQSN